MLIPITTWIYSFLGIILSVAITQIFYLLGKRRPKQTPVDFASLPYAIGVSGMSTNAAFAVSMSTNSIVKGPLIFYIFFFFILIMGSIALLQRSLWSDVRKQIVGSLLAFFMLSVMYTLWIIGSLP